MNYNIKSKIVAAVLFLSITVAFKPADSTKYYTKNGHIDFFSDTNLEDIIANNESVVSVVDISTGKVEFKVPVNSFLFDKKLMQEHFNENYLESTKYPQSTFSGSISNNSSISYNKDGSYDAKYTGTLTMHGVAQAVSGTGKIVVSGSNFTLTSSFSIKPESYNIDIPSAVKEKIAKNIAINVKCLYKPL